MYYTLEKITALTGAHHYGPAEGHVEWLLTDSRSLSIPETSLFFALRTAVGDGHKYIHDLYLRGVRQFVVDTLPDNREERYPDAGFLLTPNTLKALQRLAERHRDEYDIPIVGITGSNGKTMVKEWLYQLLAPSKRVTRSPRSYNSQIGVPLSVWMLDERTEVGIFEAGISQPGEMDALRTIIQPTIGIMTNIGPAHQENFGSMEEKCQEKLALFADSQTLIYCQDDDVIAQTIGKMERHGRLLGWSQRDARAELYIAQAERREGRTTITYVWQGTSETITIPFDDDASLHNAIHVLAAGLCLGVSTAQIRERMAQLENIAMRLEVKQGIHGCTIINDAYNSDVTSLDIALDFMNRRPAAEHRTLILSDILQSGLSSDELYAKVAEMTAHRGIDLLIGVGKEISQWQHRFTTPQCHFFPDTDALIDSHLLDTLHNQLLLIKGARSAGFDRITDLLSLRVHETTLEIDLHALTDNLDFYRSFLKPGTKMTCMVKASAYGAGSVEVAKTLQDRGVEYLAVAVADEGADLRKAGVTGNIMVMNPEMTAFHTLFEYHLEPEVYSFGLLEALIHAAGREGITNYPIHIKLDTGMHRLGFDPEHDMPALIDRLTHQNAVLPRSVFSHFAGSDSADFDAFSQEQFRRFDEGSRQLQQAFSHHILRHICNSAGIERFPQWHFDMVRLGLGLYGIDPIDNRPLHNVATLRTTILQIRRVPAGDSIGYSRRTIVDHDARIAAIPIGYADGLDRRLGNRGGYCMVNGKKAPYVGNICMDVSMIDVTGIDCKEGDSVEIFGKQLPVTTLSDALGTIPYEILTSVSDRVKRVYYQE